MTSAVKHCWMVGRQIVDEIVAGTVGENVGAECRVNTKINYDNLTSRQADRLCQPVNALVVILITQRRLRLNYNKLWIHIT